MCEFSIIILVYRRCVLLKENYFSVKTSVKLVSRRNVFKRNKYPGSVNSVIANIYFVTLKKQFQIEKLGGRFQTFLRRNNKKTLKMRNDPFCKKIWRRSRVDEFGISFCIS